MPRTFCVDFECHKNPHSRGLFSCVPMSDSTIKIARTFPHILSHNNPNLPNFNEQNWVEFCNEVDEILMAFNAKKRKISVSACHLSAAFFLFLILLMTIHSLLKGMSATVFGLTNTILVFLMVFGSCYLSSMSSENNLFVISGLNKICRKASLRFRGIVFSPNFQRCNRSGTRPIKCIFIKTGPGLRYANDDDTIPCSFSDSSYDGTSERSIEYEEYELSDEEYPTR